jgi:predicted AAA+ superfamily ATPase
VQFVIYPFSYQEFLSLNQEKNFNDYLRLGGIPFTSNIIDDEKAIHLYLEDLFNSVVLKDVVKQNYIRDVGMEDIPLYHIAIFDDEENFIRELRALLNRYSEENGIELRITSFLDGLEEIQ